MTKSFEGWPEGTYIHLYNGKGTAGGFELVRGRYGPEWRFVPYIPMEPRNG